MRSDMFLSNRKGGILLKIIAIVAFVLMVLSIEVPRRMWIAQDARTELAHKRMLDMSDCEIVYMQETGHFSKDLKSVYNYMTTNDLVVGSPDIEIEILEIDSSKIRISFSDHKHIKDVMAKTSDNKSFQSIEHFSDSFIAATKGKLLKQGFPENEVKEMLKSYTRPLNSNEKLYNVDKEVFVSLKLKDSNLKLDSKKLKLVSNDEIFAFAQYKGEKDIFWDFISNSPIHIEVVKDIEEQKVNMARYLLSDVKDKTPYLCPSTLTPFDVDFNLGAKVYLKIKFFKGENKDNYLADKTPLALDDNDKIKKYFLEIVKRKSERKVNDMVREHEMDADSSLSNQNSKDSLFGVYFTEFLEKTMSKDCITDSISTSLSSLSKNSEKNFSAEKRFAALFNANPGELTEKEAGKIKNITLLSEIKCAYETGIIKIDTISVKISSPINENSVFNGVKRNALQKKSLFGISDDKNHGSVDNGRADWK